MDTKENDGTRITTASPSSPKMTLDEIRKAWSGHVFLAEQVIDMAKKAGVKFRRNPHRTLAYYRMLDLIPSPQRLALGTSVPRPYYTIIAVTRLMRIDELKKKGWTLKKIQREIMGLPVRVRARQARDEVKSILAGLEKIIDQRAKAGSVDAAGKLELLAAILNEWQGNWKVPYRPGT